MCIHNNQSDSPGGCLPSVRGTRGASAAHVKLGGRDGGQLHEREDGVRAGANDVGLVQQFEIASFHHEMANKSFGGIEFTNENTQGSLLVH